MTNTYRIVKRAYGQYSEVELFNGSYLDAITYSMKLQFDRRDGEYLIRNLGEDYQRGSSSYQSGMDWL